MTEPTRESNEAYRLSCEVRFWTAYARKHSIADWEERKEGIAKKRGLAGLNKLLFEMNRK